ncbi:MAG: ABC transporter ATP-binding protein [Planctomycetota bacterium]
MSVGPTPISGDAPPAAQLQGVSKRFGKRPAVVNLDLAVPRGTILGLLGHNGAGKSTSIGMLLGQVYPDAGSAEVFGINVLRHRRAALSKVGAIFESPGFYPELSGRKNIGVFARCSGKVPRDRFDAVVERVGLAGRIDDKARTYSHGMRQRLALAQALLPGPELLILDEPTNGLDPEGVAGMCELIASLHQDDGLTILLSSHRLAEVERLCTDVAVMRQGRLVFAGPMAQAAGEGGLVELDCDRPAQAIAMLRGRRLLGDEPAPGKHRLRTGAEVADLARALVEDGHEIRAIGPARLTLEEVYLKLQQAAPDGSENVETASEARV